MDSKYGILCNKQESTIQYFINVIHAVQLVSVRSIGMTTSIHSPDYNSCTEIPLQIP